MKSVLAGLSRKSLFWRLFVPVAFLIVSITGTSIWLLYRTTWQLLDSEAVSRLSSTAAMLSSEVGRLQELDDADLRVAVLFEGHLKGQPWLQNIYWMDLSLDPHAVRASAFASQQKDSGQANEYSILPPGSDEIEEMIYDEIGTLFSGNVAFPDPYTLDEGRRFKIILQPMLDSFGLLEGALGIEADLQYLKLYEVFSETIRRVVSAAVIVSLLLAFWLAGSFSARINELLLCLEAISDGDQPEVPATGIAELDLLGSGIVEMGEKIKARNAQLKEVHEKNLQELAFTGGTLAHEIRNPLSAIEMHSGLLKRRFKSESDDCDSFLEISHQVDHLKKLVERFLTYSRKETPSGENFSLSELIGELKETFLMKHPGIVINETIPAELSFTADRIMMRQVFENLFSNSVAVKPVGVELTVAAEILDETLLITVSDNGPGIDPSVVEKLFTPFATTRVEGFGIGLALTRKLVEAHGGKISCDPDYSDGAKFTIELPLRMNHTKGSAILGQT